MSPGAAHPFEDLFERARDAAFILDPREDRFLAVNPAGCALLGLGRNDVLKTPISSIHPGELSQLQDFVGGVLRDGHGTTVVLTCRTGSGSCLPIEMSLHAFDGSGASHLLALVIDRSEHRKPTATH